MAEHVDPVWFSVLLFDVCVYVVETTELRQLRILEAKHFPFVDFTPNHSLQ